MDLSLYGEIIRRHEKLVTAGVVVAVLLALMSYVRVTPTGVSYRKPELWQSQSMLLLTQSGFPWGRTAVSPSAGTLQSFTELYAQFANSDEVKQRMRRAGAKKTWKIVASPVPPQVAGSSLPVIALSGQARSAKDSETAAKLGTAAFISYVQERQRTAGIPVKGRVHIQLLERSATPKPVLIKPRSKTLPLMVLLAALSATAGIALLIDRRNPRPDLVEASSLPVDAPSSEDDALPAVRTVQRWG